MVPPSVRNPYVGFGVGAVRNPYVGFGVGGDISGLVGGKPTVGNRPGVELVGGDELLPIPSEVGNLPGVEIVGELVLILSEFGLDVGRNVSTVNLPIGELVGSDDVEEEDTDADVGAELSSSAE